MKHFAVLFLCFLCSVSLFGQTTGYSYTTDHYRVYTDVSEAYAEEVADKLEGALGLFNDMFHFKLTELPDKFKVTIFNDKNGFDKYLTRILDHSRDNFVYIHFTDFRKSELVGFKKRDMTAFNASLLHQAFIQFLKAYVPNPPIWLREGIATYFENSDYDSEQGKFKFKPNFAWLDTLKAILGGKAADKTPIPLSVLLSMDREAVQERIDGFYPQAWGVVTFLLHSDNRQYNRIFWDSLNALDSEKSLRDNSLAIMKDVFSWYDESKMIKDFTAYIQSIKTFNDLITEGINHYTLEEYDKAYKIFMQSVAVEPKNYIPYYYLGLISYSKREYSQAEGYYKASLALGADESVTKYALGVNAFADNRFDAAVAYLTEAKDLNPSKYSDKVNTLLQRIEEIR
jgi:hypothetical protein